jgi:hypothetical protein
MSKPMFGGYESGTQFSNIFSTWFSLWELTCINMKNNQDETYSKGFHSCENWA